MSGLALGTRRTGRILVNKLGQSTLREPIVPVIDSEPERVFESAYDRLTNRNPAFKLLVDTLDLVEVSSTTIKPEPLPPLDERVPAEPVNPKLRQIAHQAFNQSQAYSELKAIERLASVTAVSTDRARNGIALMYAQCILSLTLSNEYYISESTPF